jgi:hypothetical protein
VGEHRRKIAMAGTCDDLKAIDTPQVVMAFNDIKLGSPDVTHPAHFIANFELLIQKRAVSFIL